MQETNRRMHILLLKKKNHNLARVGQDLCLSERVPICFAMSLCNDNYYMYIVKGWCITTFKNDLIRTTTIKQDSVTRKRWIFKENYWITKKSSSAVVKLQDCHSGLLRGEISSGYYDHEPRRLLASHTDILRASSHNPSPLWGRKVSQSPKNVCLRGYATKENWT